MADIIPKRQVVKSYNPFHPLGFHRFAEKGCANENPAETPLLYSDPCILSKHGKKNRVLLFSNVN
jgi:hypothetical protein